MSQITITHAGHTYEASLTREPRPGSPVRISIYRDDAFAGRGILSQKCVIEDCAADLGEGVYRALEAEIADALARGLHAEMDPTC
jgi:hypothetical protein